MKRFSLYVLLPVVTAAILSLAWSPDPYDETLIRVQAAHTLGPVAAELQPQPIELHALFLDYSAEPALLLAARLALLQHPDLAPPVLTAYGAEPEFQAILRQHGAAAIPAVHYFQHHEIRSLTVRRAAERGARAVGEITASIRGDSQRRAEEGAGESGVSAPLTAHERGWYAVNFIHSEGHNFLGQFAVDGEGSVEWIQTERVLEGLSGFFAGGIRTLETRYRLADETVTTGDALWAGVDVMVIGGTLKLLRISRTATKGGQPMGVVDRTRLYSAGAWRGAGTAGRLAGYAAIPTFGYLLVRHPGLLHGLFGEVGEALGIPPQTARFLGWSLLLAAVLLLFSWLGRVLLRPSVRLLSLLLALLAWMQRRTRSNSGQAAGSST